MDQFPDPPGLVLSEKPNAVEADEFLAIAWLKPHFVRESARRGLMIRGGGEILKARAT
jgi:hypothetical protein